MTAKVREFNRQFYAAMVIYSTKIHTSKFRIRKKSRLAGARRGDFLEYL